MTERESIDPYASWGGDGDTHQEEKKAIQGKKLFKYKNMNNGI